MKPGNIDIFNRPRVKNRDGSISTVRTISIGVDGKEYLIPTVSDDGRIMSDEEATRQFERTGRHLGAFRTPKEATRYAQELHRQQEQLWQPGPAPFDPKGVRGERITSTYRDPAHNRRVGGVPNSFHMRKNKRGQALARDSVPPPGMSMTAYANLLRRQNPDLEVINEGDHVHMEPRGR